MIITYINTVRSTPFSYIKAILRDRYCKSISSIRNAAITSRKYISNINIPFIRRSK
jgi:hypothetical protein